jgi:hypothetical protein
MTCEPFPSRFPRGWELMVRRPCLLSHTMARHMSLQATIRMRPRIRIPLTSIIESIAGRTCGPAGGGEHAGVRTPWLAAAKC